MLGLYKIIGAMASFKYVKHFWLGIFAPKVVPVGINLINGSLGASWFFFESISIYLFDTLINKKNGSQYFENRYYFKLLLTESQTK